MVWLHFTEDYEYRQPNFTIDYKSGMECNVTRNCATLSIAAGKAIQLHRGRKDKLEWPQEKAPEASTAE